MVPSSVANRNRLGADAPFSETTNPGPPLNTVPVGVPRDPAAPGTVTTSGTGWPPPSNRSEAPAPLSENQNGPVGLADTPHGLTRFGSATRAAPGTSEA